MFNDLSNLSDNDVFCVFSFSFCKIFNYCISFIFRYSRCFFDVTTDDVSFLLNLS